MVSPISKEFIVLSAIVLIASGCGRNRATSSPTGHVQRPADSVGTDPSGMHAMDSVGSDSSRLRAMDSVITDTTMIGAPPTPVRDPSKVHRDSAAQGEQSDSR
jgi:hypothetical protein